MAGQFQKYIEVVGCAKFERHAVEFFLEARIEHKSGFTKTETSEARVALESEKIINTVLERVVANGFPEDQITYGGVQDNWFWRNRNRGYANIRANKLIFRHEDQNTIMMLPIWIGDLDAGAMALRYSQIEPRFESLPGAEATAFGEAIANAREIAQAIGTASGTKVGDLIQAQDMALAVARHDWPEHRPYGIATVGVASGGEPPDLRDRTFEHPKKEVAVRVRALFAL